jgi:hypothetical protein
VEPDGTGAGEHLGGASPPEGHSIPAASQAILRDNVRSTSCATWSRSSSN